MVAIRTQTVVLVGRDRRGMQAQERLEGTMGRQGLSHGQAHTPPLSMASPWDGLDEPAAPCQAAAAHQENWGLWVGRSSPDPVPLAFCLHLTAYGPYQGWRDGSAVKSTDCSFEGPEFKSQQPYGGSQPSIMGDRISLSLSLPPLSYT